MTPDVCRCGACQGLALAVDDHALALTLGDPDLCRLSRTAVRLVAMLVDVRHGLATARQLVDLYREDAAGGDLLTLEDPIATARQFLWSTAP
jgi:hypothetical protein